MHTAKSPRGGGTTTGGELRIVHIPIADLRPFPGNPRRISEGELRKLMRSIQEFGMVQPLVVRRQDQSVVGGHQRLEAARRLGHVTAPVVYVEVTEAQAKALNLALNRIQGEWDLPKLGELLEELRDLPDLDETLSGFDAKEMDQLLADLERQRLPAPYEETYDVAAEMLQAQRRRAPTRVQPGETWRLGRHLLHCGDALAPDQLAALLGGRKADYVLTDAPYGISYQSTLGRRGQRKQAIENDSAEGFDDFLQKALPAIKEVMAPGAVLHWFAGAGGPTPVLAKAMLAIAEQFTLLDVLVWDRVDPGLGWRWRRSWEAVIEASLGKPALWHGGHELRNVLRFPRAIPGVDEHPTPKPIPLLEALTRAAAPTRGLVLDPFAGAGATLLAAERTGRTCCAVEIERRYCDICLARWEALSGAKATGPEGATR